MKKQVLLFSLLCGVTSFVCAQLPVEKGLNTISRSSAEATIGFLASDELQGREAGIPRLLCLLRVYSIFIAMDGNTTSE